MNAQTEPRHGDAGLERAITPEASIGQSSIRGFTVRHKAPAPPAAPTGRVGPPPPPPLRFADGPRPLYQSRPRPKLGNRIFGTLGDVVVDGRDRDPIAHSPRVRVWGAPAILADYARRGVEITLGTDGASLVVRERGDVLSHDATLVQSLRDAAPLLRAHLRGEVLPCVVGSHAAKEDATAVTIGLLGAPCCLRHAQERAS